MFEEITTHYNTKFGYSLPSAFYTSSLLSANATVSGRTNDAHSIYFPGATRRTLRISTSTAISFNAILIRCIKIITEKDEGRYISKLILFSRLLYDCYKIRMM